MQDIPALFSKRRDLVLVKYQFIQQRQVKTPLLKSYKLLKLANRRNEAMFRLLDEGRISL